MTEETRIEPHQCQVEELNTLTKQRKREVDFRQNHDRQLRQQNNVRNNREFDAIPRIEYQELEIDGLKRLKYSAGVKVKNSKLERHETFQGVLPIFTAKSPNWKAIRSETAPLVAEYAVQGERRAIKIPGACCRHDRIRNVRNGLAVVTAAMPAEVASTASCPSCRTSQQGKKIIICEYCGFIRR